MSKSEINVNRAVIAGVAAGSSYLLSAWVDSKLSSHPFNDVKLVGQMFTTDTPSWQVQGLMGHYSFSVAMSLVYAKLFYRRLPGPPWLRGITFLQIENSALYLVALAIGFDKFHAGVKKGELPPLANLKTFKGQALRHVAFGAALGALYRSKD